MNDTIKGFLAILAACVIWGLSGLYYKVLAAVPPLEVLAHRTLWSVVFLVIFLVLLGRLAEVGKALDKSSLLRLAFAAVMVSANWFFFIWSVQSGHALEASFGYYIFPLVAVLMGFVIFKERLKMLQTLAVTLVLLAVLTLGFGLGIAPWIAGCIALTMGFYGVIKKGLQISSLVSVLIEVVILSPIALFVLIYFHSNEQSAGGYFGSDVKTTVLLIFSGILTAGPLILFSYAAQRLRMATVGLLQYLNPSLQFVVAVFAFGEAISVWHLVALAIIWLAISLYSFAAFQRQK